MLTVANHPRIWQKVNSEDGRASRLAAKEISIEQQIDELFLATLSRSPTTNERKASLDYVERSESRESGLRGLLWGLVNTKEFLLQH